MSKWFNWKNLAHNFVKRVAESSFFAVSKIDPDEQNWVSLSKGPQRDLTPYTQDYSDNLAYYLWLTNPLAAKIVETHQDFIIGDGLRLVSEDEDLQKVLDDFWYDEVNDFEIQQYAIAGELFLFGELLFLPFINQFDGLCQMARIDPVLIKEAIPHPKFPQVTLAVQLKPQANIMRDDKNVETLMVIHLDRDPRSPDAGTSQGDCFYFAINKLSSKRRGHSQFYRTSDWLDIYDKRMFNEAERQEIQNNWAWQVKLKGATQEQVQKYLESVKAPKNGSLLGTNDSVDWSLVIPDFKSQDFAESNRQFLRLILGTYGIPEHWLSLGGDVNLATANAMAAPTLKALKRHQKFIVKCFNKLVDYQIEKAKRAGALARGKEYEYEILVDEIEVRDLQNIGTFLVNMVNALTLGESNNWITKDEAAAAFTKHFAQTGIELEPMELTQEPTEEQNKILSMFEGYRKRMKAGRKGRKKIAYRRRAAAY